jgi:uncharacterized protein with GYD domain
MGKYDAVEVHGVERETALAAAQDQIAAWGVKIPPLVAHFGLNKFMEIVKSNSGCKHPLKNVEI